MKKMALIFSLVVILPMALCARMGESMEQCEARYGKPVEGVGEQPDEYGSLMYMYKSKGVHVVPSFYEGTVEGIMYFRRTAFLRSDIEILLEANGGGKKWIRQSALGSWKTEDGELIASYDPLKNMLAITSKAAMDRARKVEESKSKEALSGF